MSDRFTPSRELSPNAAPWHASEAHPVPPVAGSYIPVDHSELLSAAVPGVICPVLVLPHSSHDAD
jgi:hypothetical protein